MRNLEYTQIDASTMGRKLAVKRRIILFNKQSFKNRQSAYVLRFMEDSKMFYIKFITARGTNQKVVPNSRVSVPMLLDPLIQVSFGFTNIGSFRINLTTEFVDNFG